MKIEESQDTSFAVGLAMNAETKKLVYGPGRFGGWTLILVAVFSAPFYFVQCKSAVSHVWNSPFTAWLPVLRETAADILKVVVMLKFGFYFKDQTERRASTRLRRSDALQITVLGCLLFAALLPWYAAIPMGLLMLPIYFWELRDIRTSEKADAFEASFSSGLYPKRSS